jgi:hypothetical protein
VEGHLSPFRGDILEEMSAQIGTDQNVNLRWFLVGPRSQMIPEKIRESRPGPEVMIKYTQVV